MGNPALLRPVLSRYPELRISLQHAGMDFLDEIIVLLREFPGVYVDLGVLNSIGPAAQHKQTLRRLAEADLADRILFGSDDFDYTTIIARIEGTKFLTAAQRRAIYYDNAARFLKLSEEQIAADHRCAPRHHPCSP